MSANEIRIEASAQDCDQQLARLEAFEDFDFHSLVNASEIYLRADRPSDAAEVMRHVVRRFPHNAAMHTRLGAILVRLSNFDDAIRNLRSAVALEPSLRLASRQLVHALLLAGIHGEAIEVIDKDIALNGEDHDELLRTARILLANKRPADAYFYAARATRLPQATDETFNVTATSALQAEKLAEGAVAAEESVRRTPLESSNRILLVGILVALRHYDRAVEVAQDGLRLDPSNARLERALSAALALGGDLREALRAGLRAVRLDVESQDYWIHLSGLANQLGMADLAIQCMERGADLDPPSAVAHSALARMEYTRGNLEKAIQHASKSVAYAPDDEANHDFYLTLLEQRAASKNAASVAPRARIAAEGTIGAAPPPKRLDRTFSQPLFKEERPFTEALRIQLRVLGALILREAQTRYADSKLGIFWAVGEPLMHLTALSLIFSVFNHGHPPLGWNWFFFYATGVVPFYMFSHVTSQGHLSVSVGANILQLPIVNRFDIIFTTAVLDLAINFAYGAILFASLYTLGLGPAPSDPVAVILSFFGLWLLAFGIALINAVIEPFNKTWLKLWPTVIRLLYFTSGIFYMAQRIPLGLREYFVWNPVLIGIEWFRSGFFDEYNPPWLSPGFLLLFGTLATFTGVVMERTLQRPT